jgi:broad specificity phosphatase PhoE
MTGIELVIGYVAAWAWQKARRVAGRADAEVDQALDAGMDRLHELVAGKLAGDRALAQLETEAGSNLEVESVSPRTRERVRLALEEAVETDPDFGDRLAEVVAQLQKAEGQPGVAAGEHGLAVGGDVDIHAEGGSVAGGVIHGNVNVGNPPPPGPRNG